jgi:hypothetical protein
MPRPALPAFQCHGFRSPIQRACGTRWILASSAAGYNETQETAEHGEADIDRTQIAMPKRIVDRCYQALLIVSVTGLAWLLMMIAHEFGHVLHGWLSGATVALVAIPPLGFSRTDFATNPHPLFVAWGGAVWGCLIPLGLLAVVRFIATSSAYLAAWYAGFCLVANGAYLVAGSFFGGSADDAGVILQSGGARWSLVAFGLPAVAIGLFLWHGLGRHFGLGAANGTVSRKTAVALAATLCILIVVEMELSKP